MSITEWAQRRRALLVLIASAAVVGALLVASQQGWFATQQTRVVVLYCYSTLDDVMQDRLLPAFRDEWSRERGEPLEFVATFAGSGGITGMIARKVPAEVAIVTSELDAHRLPGPYRSWRALPHAGVLARSPLVIVTRPGNPKQILGFGDLARDGVALLHGDPATSGAAGLAILAEHDAGLRDAGEPELAAQRLRATWQNVIAMLPSSREVRRRFEAGAGDAFVTYEQDVLRSPSRAAVEGEVVHPRGTVVAEPIVVKLAAHITADQRELIDAFVEYLWSPEAQRILVDYGFRSVTEEPGRPDQPPLDEPRTLDDLGGWQAWRTVVDGVWKKRVAPELPR